MLFDRQVRLDKRMEGYESESEGSHRESMPVIDIHLGLSIRDVLQCLEDHTSKGWKIYRINRWGVRSSFYWIKLTWITLTKTWYNYLYFNVYSATYLHIKTMISTAAILVSRAFTEEHCPFFNEGRLITSKQILFAIKPKHDTEVRDIPWTINSKYGECNSYWASWS